MSTTDVADSGVTATVWIDSSGSLETSWIESTAPSLETQSRGSRSSVSAWRAYSIDEIGAVSSSPATRRRLSSVGTPVTSSNSASTRKKTGAMFAYEMRPSRITTALPRPVRTRPLGGLFPGTHLPPLMPSRLSRKV